MNEEKQNINLENEDLNNNPMEDAQAKSASKTVSDSNQETPQPAAQESSQASDSTSDSETSAQDNTEATSENSEKEAPSAEAKNAPEAETAKTADPKSDVPEGQADTPVRDDEKIEKKAEDSDKIPDYNSFTKQALLEALKTAVQEDDVQKARSHVDAIKASFYKLQHERLAELKKLFVESGKDPMDFDPPKDKDETYLKELLEDFKAKKAKFNAEQEAIKLENLKKKEAIIEKIKVLANGEESLRKTFEEFRDLQNLWKKIGTVPKEKASELWNNYNLQVERFYDFIKINNELRDMDFKKNLELKIELCEKAEKLILEPKIIDAYRKLQDFHDLWREIGPVPKEKREELWERFSMTSQEINKKHQDYFLKKKEEREHNLNAKNALCEKAEIIANQNIEDIKEWNERTNEVMELQKVWKTVGMVPQKHNAAIYDRFRSACNLFFDKKQEFFKQRKSEFDENLQKKTDICVRAEALQNNTNWNDTRDQILKMQEEWKTVGPVPKRQSDEVWKRFRAACNTFFTARDNYFKTRKNEEKENLKKKQDLIEAIKAFKASDDKAKNLNALQDFQTSWTQTGFVPKREKDKLQDEYKDAIKTAFQGIDVTLSGLSDIQYQKQVDEWIKADDNKKIEGERQRLNQKIKKIKEDIVLQENNMSFFTGSSSGSLLDNVKKKIEKAKQEKSRLMEKRKILDLALRNLKNE
ncbi:MAG: DUF349 domain-containing protein [Bacteroidales bacterium]|jgi:hypothetical protein|nr:DUF349 domain-containing protein [Bacteroidales bacterium]